MGEPIWLAIADPPFVRGMVILLQLGLEVN